MADFQVERHEEKYPNGNLRLVNFTFKGEKTGPHLEYWPNGKPRCIGIYSQGVRVSEWNSWYPDGRLSGIRFYTRKTPKEYIVAALREQMPLPKSASHQVISQAFPEELRIPWSASPSLHQAQSRPIRIHCSGEALRQEYMRSYQRDGYIFTPVGYSTQMGLTPVRVPDLIESPNSEESSGLDELPDLIESPDPDDIRIVMMQVEGASREMAVEALRIHRNDLLGAILETVRMVDESRSTNDFEGVS